MVDIMPSNKFEPEWAVPPGDTISAILSARSVSRERLAELLGESLETVQRLLVGLESVSDDLAIRLAECLGSSEQFWRSRELQYRTDRDRQKKHELDRLQGDWVKQFPIKDMANLGWIPKSGSLENTVTECLRFFDVSDLTGWQARYAGSNAAAAFRMPKSTTSNPFSVTAWLRCAELVAQRIPCANWNPVLFRHQLEKIRRLTWRKKPSDFLPLLRALCAEAGVVVVVARTPTGCPANGATRFLSPQKALIVLSFRYRSDDQFWFTFFHESGHLLLHSQDALFLEDGSDVTADEEDEANEFAESMIIPEMHVQQFYKVHLEKNELIRFARHVGIAPGLLVGQLQHKGRITHDRLNKLKRRYTWDDIQADQLIP